MLHSDTGSVSWADLVTFNTFLEDKVKCAVALVGSVYQIRYYCMNPKVPSGCMYYTANVPVANNPFVNVGLLEQIMQTATHTLYTAVADSTGDLRPPTTVMLYTDCCTHIPKRAN